MGVRHQLLILAFLTSGCSSYQIARNVKMMSFTNEPKAKEVSTGVIEGRSCQWQAFSWPLGEEPTIRNAFANAVTRKDGGAIPGMAQEQVKEGKLSILRNVSTDSSFLSLYVVHRRCINVSGLGAL